MTDILIAVGIAAGIVAGIGALCAVVLVFASKFFAVEVDETFTKVRECLPGANCGACGYAGCDGYAQALADGTETNAGLCIPGADATSAAIAELLGLEAQDIEEMVAVVSCFGDCEHTSNKMDYVGIESCEAAKLMYGGRGQCVYGCIGFGDCAAVCPEDAICMEKGIAHIDPRRCIGCGMCTRTCPRGIISLKPAAKLVRVTCNNTEKGALVRGKCSNGCIGCKKCEKTCPEGAITVENNLARIDYSKCTSCGKCAEVCPTGTIKKNKE